MKLCRMNLLFMLSASIIENSTSLTFCRGFFSIFVKIKYFDAANLSYIQLYKFINLPCRNRRLDLGGASEAVIQADGKEEEGIRCHHEAHATRLAGCNPKLAGRYLELGARCSV